MATELPFELGMSHAYTAGDGVALILGKEFCILDDGKYDRAALRPFTMFSKRVRLVLNSSGVALLPGMTVRYKAGSYGKEVDGYTAVTAERAVVVDEFLPAAGVPNGEMFFVTVEGPTIVKTDPAPGHPLVIATGQRLIAVTAAASTHSTTAGHVNRMTTAHMVAPTDVTSAITNLERTDGWFATALSAATTANTNSNLLAYVRPIHL